MKKLLDKSDVSKIPSEALSTARGNLALLDNLTRFITNNIYENNKKDVKIARVIDKRINKSIKDN